MSIFRNKILIKIVASLCVVLTIINMGVSNTVHADNLSEYGGILIVPVTSLLISVCDGVVGLLHETILYQDITLIQISGEPNWWKNFWKPAAAIIITTLVVLITGFVVGPAIMGAVGVGAKLMVAGSAALKIGIAHIISVQVTGEGILHIGTFVAEKLGHWFSGTLYMPVYTITPRHIFSNQIRLFDINFFNPMDSEEVKVEGTKKEEYYDIVKVYYDTKGNIERDENWVDGITVYDENVIISKDGRLSKDNNWKNSLFMEQLRTLDATQHYSIEDIINKISPEYKDSVNLIINEIDVILKSKGETLLVNRTAKIVQAIWAIDEEGKDGNLYNTVKLTIDYKPSADNDIQQIVILISMVLKVETEPQIRTLYSSAAQVKDVVGEWYFILRNISLIMLMIILVYVGIRIVIGSTAGQKAKYKERLKDWLVAICLLFIMHYIMVFAVNLVGMITELLKSTKIESGVVEYIPLENEHKKSLNELQEMVDNPEVEELNRLGTICDDGNTLAWTTDIMGKFRIMAQTTEEGTVKWVGYAMCYMVLVIFTVFFAWTYIKRVLYMAFLTLMAPVVAMTYPLDKINDGKAQAFSMWLKEYIFNLLIQPMHLLLYTILVTSAYKLATTNAIYAIVAIGFMVPSEQLIRKFFGFNKAQTAGTLGGAAGAALAYTGLQKAMSFTKKLTGKEDKEKDKNGKDIKWAGEGVNARETVANTLTQKKPENSEGGSNKNTKIRGANGEGQDNSNTNNTENSSVRMNNPPENKPEPNEEKDSKKTPPENAKETEESNAAENKPEPAKNNDKSEKSKKDQKIRGNLIRGVAGTTGMYFRQLGTKMEKRVKKQKPIRSLVRGAAGIYGGAVMGMAGAALGVASGDPSKALQYSTAAALGGYGVGRAVGGKAVDSLHVNSDKLWDEIETTFYGKDYKKKKLDEAVKKMSKNEKNISEIRQYIPELSRGDASAILGGEIGRKCYESGFTDMEDIAAVYKAATEHGLPPEVAISGLKFSNYLPSKLKELGDEERLDMINKWAKDYQEMKESDPDKYKDLNPEQAAAMSLSLAEKMGKIKSGLTET